ncbi:MmcQ/YjbR family DNA-binding protein [Zophobihabitans entericus]|uniref:MmcQ/YjbR family DNA-binding protein n=1 Tax=Zophobihabitans entericus TaxID=1635327 RepID=UPI001AAEC772|nr:MmcQ/YjbR family DNA-binding protein [Zophobihabitans entericus]
MVRADYHNVLQKIAEQCFELNIFKSDDAKKIIEYIRNTYHDELEFLWPKFPNNAIFRRKDTSKWYGAILTLSKRKLGIESDEIIEILDLRINPEEVTAVVDHKTFFPGYHMNKKHWYTICLDGSLPIEDIYQRIDISYQLATK